MTPHVAKPRTIVQSHMVDKPPIMPQLTVSYELEAHASREVGSQSASCAVPIELNCVVLRPHFHSDRSCQLLIESGNRTQRWGHDNRDIIAP